MPPIFHAYPNTILKHKNASPDLTEILKMNPIKNIWYELERWLYAHNIVENNVAEVRQALREDWQATPHS